MKERSISSQGEVILIKLAQQFCQSTFEQWKRPRGSQHHRTYPITILIFHRNIILPNLVRIVERKCTLALACTVPTPTLHLTLSAAILCVYLEQSAKDEVPVQPSTWIEMNRRQIRGNAFLFSE